MIPQSSETLNEVLTACQASLEQAAAALTRAFGDSYQLQVLSSGKLDLAELPPEMESSALLLTVTVGAEGALLVLPETGTLLPDWCQTPDGDQTSTLAELAQELASLWLPPLAVIENAQAGYVPNAAEAVLRGGAKPTTLYVRLSIETAAGQPANLYLLWPVTSPVAALDPTLPVPTVQSGGSVPGRKPRSAQRLPSYSKSLLQIQVPVTVTLAAQKLPLSRVIELAPGSLLQFEKSCEELLEVEVNSHPIALGEAVKVGDKFGVRVSSMILPDERFVPIGKPHK